jgi:hypothetical protein
MEHVLRSIQVIATTYDGTRAAIETAVLLARASESTLTVLVPQIVPDPVDIVEASEPLGEVVDEYRRWLVQHGGSGLVRVCLCRDIDDVIERLTVPNTTLVIGGPSGRWRMSPEERFANRLSRQGRQVLFAATGPSPTSRRRSWTAALVCVLSASALAVNASAQPPAIQYGGFLDAAILASNTDPPNHLFRNRGTTPRLDELDLNMAGAYVRKGTSDVSSFGFEATVQAGEDSKLFGFSATAPNIAGADVLTHFGPTSASYRAPVGSGLTIQGGIFSSLIGYDSLYAKDNFAYTRPWGADYTPYLMLGVNAAYPVTPRFTVTGFVVNGYWHLAHANDVPSVGSQFAFTPHDGLSLKQTVLYGPHQTDTSIAWWRVLSDSIVERKLNRLTIAGELQVSTERVDSASRAWWVSVQAPAHVLITGPWSATVRPEWCRDSEGRWTGFVQSVAAITTTVEYRLSRGPSSARLRAEYRYDRSTGAGGGFFAAPATPSETLRLVPGQQLAIGAVILAFDGIAERP